MNEWLEKGRGELPVPVTDDPQVAKRLAAIFIATNREEPRGSGDRDVMLDDHVRGFTRSRCPALICGVSSSFHSWSCSTDTLY